MKTKMALAAGILLAAFLGGIAGHWLLSGGSATTAQTPSGTGPAVRVTEAGMDTSYANAFRTNGSAEEVMLDFGVNLLNPASAQQDQQEIIFKINERVVMNYYSAKRLAITLSQLIRRHEDDFGELELDVNKRRKGSG